MQPIIYLQGLQNIKNWVCFFKIHCTQHKSHLYATHMQYTMYRSTAHALHIRSPRFDPWHLKVGLGKTPSS